MTDITTNSLKGIIKTLSDVVAPAIPEDDPLAFQELKLAIRYLNFARERVDHLYARARFELAFYARLAADLAAPLAERHAAHAQGLTALHDGAAALLAQPGAGIEELRHCMMEITRRIAAILGDVGDADVLARMERLVVASSAEITAFDRSWYAPLKLERFPHQVRPLGSFIPVPQAASQPG